MRLNEARPLQSGLLPRHQQRAFGRITLDAPLPGFGDQTRVVAQQTRLQTLQQSHLEARINGLILLPELALRHIAGTGDSEAFAAGDDGLYGF